jgi:uncharacterized protein YPO0396
MRSIPVCCLSLVALALTCCTRSPADQLKTELQTVASWTATAHMVGDAWLKGAVPHAYVTKTLVNARETLQEETKTIEELKPEAGAELLDQTRNVGQLVEQMRAAIEKKDNQTLAQLLKQLEAEEQAVKATAKSGGVTQP